jgi:hypothetical protein
MDAANKTVLHTHPLTQRSGAELSQQIGERTLYLSFAAAEEVENSPTQALELRF